jgi:hypothetical protein
MAQENNLTKPVHSASLGKRMLQGAVPALILIIAFLATAGEPDPEWGKFWRIQPLALVTFAGAMGGLCYYFLDHLRYQGGLKKVLAYILSFIIYLFSLWMGIVLGLNGTYWH